MLVKILRSYKNLPKNIHLLFFLEFILSLIHVAFILILNIYLRKQGYSDPDIASFNSLRFIGALTFAIPLGIYIRGKNLRPFFQLATFIVPFTSILVIEAIHHSITPLIQLSFFSWGIGMTLVRVCSLPFIIRHTDANNSTEALSLIASTWSLSTIFSGLMISGLDWLDHVKVFGHEIRFNEYEILWLITSIGFFSYIFTKNIDEINVNKYEENEGMYELRNSYDWALIFKAISPLILISIGAGLTIPFVNLFFNSVFGFTSSSFSMLGSFTAFLVFVFSLMVPTLRKKYGYWMTIVVVQSVAIVCLIVMSLTEIYAYHSYALIIAVVAFILRQPMMHMAHPSSNELMMSYVGKKNQELISAISSSLWSASWFISAKIFEWLRVLNFQYYEIFLVTAALYAIGVILFGFLIKEHEQNEKKHSRVYPIADEFKLD